MGDLLKEGPDTEEEIVAEPDDAIKSSFLYVWSRASEYGWPLLGLAVLLVWLWNKYGHRLRSRIRASDDVDLHRDSDVILARQEAMDRARRRLQEEHDKMAAEHAVKMKEKEEAKRKAKLEDYDKGYKSKTRPAEQPPEPVKRDRNKPRLREGFSPLMGDSSARFTPSHRGGASGGG